MLSVTGGHWSLGPLPHPRNIPMMPDFQTTLTFLSSCIWSCFFKLDGTFAFTLLYAFVAIAKTSNWKKTLQADLSPTLYGSSSAVSSVHRCQEKHRSCPCGLGLLKVLKKMCKAWNLEQIFTCWFYKFPQQKHSLASAGWNLRRFSSACDFDRKQISFHVVAWICRRTQGLKPVVCKCLYRAKQLETTGETHRLPELRSGKHQRWVVVLVLVPLSNMWWC